jgi:hypothetical protein
VEVIADRTTVTPPPRTPQAVVCPPDHPQGCVSGHIRYDLPDIVTAGVTWHITPPLAITAIFRWLTFSQHDQIGIRVVGPANGSLRTAGLPERIVLYRGFQDVFEGRVAVEGDLSYRLRLGASLRADTGAVAPSRLSPGHGGRPHARASRDGRRAGLGLAAPHRRLRLHGDADGLTGASVFNPTPPLPAPAPRGTCPRRLHRAREGVARPTAAGRYGLTQHTATLTAMFRF